MYTYKPLLVVISPQFRFLAVFRSGLKVTFDIGPPGTCH